MGTILFFVLFFEINRIFLDFIVWRRGLLKHKDFSCPQCLDQGRFLGYAPQKFTIRGCVFGCLKVQKRGGGEGKEHLPCCSYQVGIVL